VLWLDKIGNENKWNEWLNTTKCREKIVCYKREREKIQNINRTPYSVIRETSLQWNNEFKLS
jgi:hypothetical protein